MSRAVLFDLDGTRVDSTCHHALARYRALRRHDVTAPAWRLQRAIGMGGDRLVGEFCGPDLEQRLGDEVRTAWTGAPQHVRHHLRLLDADDLLAALNEAEDASSSEPAPDLLAVALDRAGGGAAVCVGDANDGAAELAAAVRAGTSLLVDGRDD